MEENTITLLPLVKKPKSFGRWDSFSLIITDRRLIFAEMTSDMLKEAAAEAQQKGKEEGKGFFARWGDQLKATFTYAERYRAMPPEEVLNYSPGNFAIPNDQVRKIEFKQKTDIRSSDDISRTFTEFKIESNSGKLQYTIDGYSKETLQVLKDLFGDRVKK